MANRGCERRPRPDRRGAPADVRVGRRAGFAARRQLVGGLIPVGRRREAHVNAGVRSTESADEDEPAAVPGADTRLAAAADAGHRRGAMPVTQAIDEIERSRDSAATQPTRITDVFGSTPVPARYRHHPPRARADPVRLLSTCCSISSASCATSCRASGRCWPGTRPRGDLDAARELPLLVRLEQTVLAVNKTELTSGSGHVSGNVRDNPAQGTAWPLRSTRTRRSTSRTWRSPTIGASLRPRARGPIFLFPLADVGPNAALAVQAGKTGPFHGSASPARTRAVRPIATRSWRA
ncbi:MAG: hypothetical protein MZW92_40900 [Comamonadaceae bacterium]|nr:hypothetical protein [Comamonadaceae bacterium]